jgi:hypothetical protein
MTEKELDLVHLRKEKIWSAVHKLVDKLTKDLPANVDELVRLQLTEQFRFWRTIK